MKGEADRFIGERFLEWTMAIMLGVRVEIERDGKPPSEFDSAGKKSPPRSVWYEPKREPMRPRAGYIGLQTHDPELAVDT